MREAAEAGDDLVMVACPFRGIRSPRASFKLTERSWSAKDSECMKGR